MTPRLFALAVALPILMLAVMTAFIRLVMGPTLADRVVAFDLLASIAIGIIAAYAVAADQPVLLDVTIVLALVSFLGTIGFALYLKRRALR